LKEINAMKRLTVFIFALLLGASLSFAQNAGGDKNEKGKTTASDNDKGKDKDKGSKKGHHKGGKKGKKSTDPVTPPPK
jgi:hypothetical protein